MAIPLRAQRHQEHQEIFISSFSSRLCAFVFFVVFQRFVKEFSLDYLALCNSRFTEKIDHAVFIEKI